VTVAQGVLADLYGLVVPAAPDQSVADEVLGARRDRTRTESWAGAGSSSKRVALEAAHHRRAEPTGKHRSLAKGFGHPAPAGLLGDVQHRGERPGDAVHARFGRGEPRRTKYEVLVPCGGQPERDREDRAVSVDDVPPEEQRDPQA